MSLETKAIQVLDKWYAELRLFQDKLPSKGTISAALIVLQRLRTNFDLDVASHVASGEAQIAGLSASSLQPILREFGETRVLSAVGGRSNRGARGDIAKLLSGLKNLGLDHESQSTRLDVIKAMQCHIVENFVTPYFKVKRVKAFFDPTSATSKFLDVILENARASGKAGAVAEYLVGAKLSLKFPKIDIRNKPFSSADTHAGHEGDFRIGNTAFHVTVAPMPELFVKIKGNLDRGFRVYLLVPNAQVVGAKQNAELTAPGKIEVDSIQSFIATNIDEHCQFDGEKLKSGFRRFLETYNERVDAVELDKSMLIEVPPNI